MPRYGLQPIPRTKAAFLAALKRAEAKAWRQAAESLRPVGGPMTLEEHRERMLMTARDRDSSAVFIEYLDRNKPADRDELLANLYTETVKP